MPALPKELAKQLVTELGISHAEANMLAEDTELYQYFTVAKATIKTQKSLVNWLLGPIRALLNEQNSTISGYQVKPAQLAAVINLVDDKKISQAIALQKLLPALITYVGDDVAALAQQLNLLIVEDNDALDGFIAEVLTKYEAQVQAYKTGKKGVLGLFVGEVMKLAKGKADAKKINDLLIEKLK
ncbi:hypothetical protein [Pedobacter sp. UC225_65]|uniref:hypothetical protein n=1 Tax=Pedobacter sp. UC225_65 TaxID=3350173 RepID=UPI00366D3BBC